MRSLFTLADFTMCASVLYKADIMTSSPDKRTEIGFPVHPWEEMRQTLSNMKSDIALPKSCTHAIKIS